MNKIYLKYLLVTIGLFCITCNVYANDSKYLKQYYKIANLKFNKAVLAKYNVYKVNQFYENRSGKELDSILLGVQLGKYFKYKDSNNIFYKQNYCNYILYNSKPEIEPNANKLAYLRVVTDKKNVVSAVICYIGDPTGENFSEDYDYNKNSFGEPIVLKNKNIVYWENKTILEYMGICQAEKKIFYTGIWLKTAK